MAGPYYTHTPNLFPFVKARSGDVEANFQALVTALALVAVDMGTALRAPDGETPIRIPAAADRANKSLVFDSAGAPAASLIATSLEMSAAVAAAASAHTDATNAHSDALTVAGAVNALHLLQLYSGVL